MSLSAGLMGAQAFAALESTPTIIDESREAGALRLEPVEGERRLALERFIAQRFAEVYGARIRTFMPRLYGLSRSDAQPWRAAFGLRPAQDERLFLEQYLAVPVERAIRMAFDTAASREQIVEVGNLAGAGPGALRDLIPVLTEHLYLGGARWVAFTGSAPLCNGFARLGLPLYRIASARPDCLPPAERSDWGSYYEVEPAVMIGDVAAGHASLLRSRRLGVWPPLRLACLASLGAP